MTDTELNPCDFCGNDGSHEPIQVLSGICVGAQRTAVHCGACFARGPSVHDTHSNARNEAIKEWNTRQPDKVAEGLAEALDRAIGRYSDLSDVQLKLGFFINKHEGARIIKARAALKAYHDAKKE